MTNNKTYFYIPLPHDNTTSTDYQTLASSKYCCLLTTERIVSPTIIEGTTETDGLILNHMQNT